VMDLYVANVIHELQRKSLPDPFNGFENVQILFTKHFMKRLEQKKLPEWYKRWRPYEMRPAAFKRVGGNVFTFYRERSEPELKLAGIPPASVLFYSQWSRYRAEVSFKKTESFCNKHGIEIVEAHTSGHAVCEDLQRLEKALNPKKVIPIHSNSPEKYVKYFGVKVDCLQDGELQDV
jgi:ribonuclease J